jgi:hypothetical protein
VTLIHHDDLIGRQDRREAVRNRNHRSPGGEGLERCWICFSDSNR